MNGRDSLGFKHFCLPWAPNTILCIDVASHLLLVASNMAPPICRRNTKPRPHVSPPYFLRSKARCNDVVSGFMASSGTTSTTIVPRPSCPPSAFPCHQPPPTPSSPPCHPLRHHSPHGSHSHQRAQQDQVLAGCYLPADRPGLAAGQPCPGEERPLSAWFPSHLENSRTHASPTNLPVSGSQDVRGVGVAVLQRRLQFARSRSIVVVLQRETLATTLSIFILLAIEVVVLQEDTPLVR